MPHLLLFGPGYTGSRLAASFVREGWIVQPVGRAQTPDFAGVTHILSTVPPGESDPILAAHGPRIAASGAWLGYLSSTGVYGDAGGAWVDESAPIAGRRASRNAADAAWLALGARVFRLPGIYGPGRSPLDRVRAGQAHRTGLAEQIFSRVHVNDIIAGVRAAMREGPAGVYNLGDDLPCAQDDVIDCAAAMLGLPPPPIVGLESLSPAARAFYAENRRIANGKAKRLLGWRPLYPDYRAGLRALIATTSPATTSAPPPIVSGDQR